jgi:GNAT superfamily N-acetyltransferase
VIDGSKEADVIERTDTLEDIAHNYECLTNCDPYRDMLFAEVGGLVVGYSRMWWWQGKNGDRRYSHFNFLLPDWRGTGIRRAMLHHSERHLGRIAASHPPAEEKSLDAWASDTEAHWESLLLDEGYRAERYGFSMVRPELDDFSGDLTELDKVLPLPDGIEVRPAQSKHCRAIWEAAREAFRDEWGYSESEWTDEQFEAWQTGPTFDPSLWQVAWDGDQVVALVLNFINHEENDEYNRKRGYTETICVRRPWRRQGVAKALIARSFRMHKALGMTEAALGVDAQNPNGALQLYKSMGFQVVKRHTTYRKSLDQA